MDTTPVRLTASDIYRMLGDYAKWFVTLGTDDKRAIIFAEEWSGNIDRSYMLRALLDYTV